MPTADTGVLRMLVLRGSGALGVMAENATDTVLTDLVLALVIDPVKVELRPAQTKVKLDTFEFFLARIAPREIITRTGGTAVEGSVVTAVTYPAQRVVGRRIGGAVSRMPRITRVDVRPSSRAEDAGMAVQLIAEAYDTVRRAPRDYDDFPAHWTVWSSGARAYLTDTTSRRATVHAEHEGLAHVSATIGGVTGSADINFTMDQRSVMGPGSFESIRRVLPDGSIEYLNLGEGSRVPVSKLDPYLIMRLHLCTIQPSGTVRYASWLRPWAARVRADMAAQHAMPDSARLLLERLKECNV
jgi:hypothetical protein